MNREFCTACGHKTAHCGGECCECSDRRRKVREAEEASVQVKSHIQALEEHHKALQAAVNTLYAALRLQKCACENQHGFIRGGWDKERGYRESTSCPGRRMCGRCVALEDTRELVEFEDTGLFAGCLGAAKKLTPADQAAFDIICPQ